MHCMRFPCLFALSPSTWYNACVGKRQAWRLLQARGLTTTKVERVTEGPAEEAERLVRQPEPGHGSPQQTVTQGWIIHHPD
jgi:hypothetical protein